MNTDLPNPEQKDHTPGVIPTKLPVLTLRDVVVYPYTIFPVLVGRESSLRATYAAMERDKYIFLSAQKNPAVDEPTEEDLYREGTIAKITQTLKLPNGLIKIVVDGVAHATVVSYLPNSNFLEVEVRMFAENQKESDEIPALVRRATTLFAEYVPVSRNIPPEVFAAMENIRDPRRRLYYIAANITQSVETKQKILQVTTLKEQYYELIQMLS